MRLENSIKNVKYNMISQVLMIIISFISRTIFIKILGESYLGVSGLFSNILTILSLADMGIGTVLVYSMYKPLAKNDRTKMKQLMNTYKKVYYCIAGIILLTGLCIMPFVQYLIKEVPENISHLNFIFFLYLLNTVVSYLCIYKISIITADQKNYIVTIRKQIATIIANILMAIALIITHNFIIYLIIQIFGSIMTNIYLSKVAEKKYSFIKETKGYELEKEEKKELKKNVFAMIFHKIGGVVVSGTDNIIMSVMIGIEYVGIYSNYLLIINTVKTFVSQIFQSITASIGNLTVEDNKEHTYNIFKKIFFANFWIVGFCAICLIGLLNPFITIWVGESLTFPILVVGMIVLVFFVDGMRQTVLAYKDAMGLFWYDRYKPIFEGVINLVVSVICAYKFGIIGIFIGTFVSMTFVCLSVESYVVYKYGFKRKWKEYFQMLFKYISIDIIALIITFGCNNFITQTGIIGFILQCISTAIIPNIIFIIFTFRTDEFKYFFNLIKNKILKKEN